MSLVPESQDSAIKFTTRDEQRSWFSRLCCQNIASCVNNRHSAVAVYEPCRIFIARLWVLVIHPLEVNTTSATSSEGAQDSKVHTDKKQSSRTDR